MSYPPPPPFQPRPVEKPSPAAWLIPLAGLLALVGAFTPWFKPEVTVTANGRSISDSVDNALYSWKDGKVGLIAPIVLVLLGIGVIGLLRGRKVSRFDTSRHGSVVAAARGALIAGVVSLVAVAIAWFLLPHQYRFTVGSSTYGWDDLKTSFEQRGADSVDIGHGPQLGYWLTIGAAVLAIVGGALMLALRRKPAVPAPAEPGFKPPTGPPLQGYPPAPDQQWQQGQSQQPLAYQPPPVTQPPAYEPPPMTQPPVYQPQHGQSPQFTKDDRTPPVQH